MGAGSSETSTGAISRACDSTIGSSTHSTGAMNRYPFRGRVSNNFGVLRVVIKSFPNFLDRGVDRVIELDKLAFFPKCLLNLRSGHQLTGSTGEKSEQTARLILQSNAPAVLSKLDGSRSSSNDSKRRRRDRGFAKAFMWEHSITALALLQIPRFNNNLAVQMLYRWGIRRS